MKKILLLFFCYVLLNGCKKDMPEPLTNTSVNSTFGNKYKEYYITFFTNSFSSPGAIPVTFNGATVSITYAYNYNPGCSALGCPTFTVPPGTYSYSGGFGSQTGTIVTGASQCITILIN